MPRKPKDSGMVKAGQIELWLPDGFDGKKKTSLEKAAKPPTKAQEKLVDTALLIRQDEPDAEDAAYMARELVQCTLPHSDPGPVPFWARRNGNLTLSIVSGFDPKTVGLVGYPFGSIPRLILFWVTTEALQTQSRRLYLGSSYNTFLREIGFNPNTGGGKRGDGKRVREQTRRLFAASISFIQTFDSDRG